MIEGSGVLASSNSIIFKKREPLRVLVAWAKEFCLHGDQSLRALVRERVGWGREWRGLMPEVLGYPLF
jgi:hypothetical protein